MVFEDTSANFFTRNDSHLSANTHLENTQQQKKDFFYYLKEYNSFLAPALAHVSILLICLFFGLFYDKVIKLQFWSTFPVLILAIILFLFPFLFTLQRKIETNTWTLTRLKSFCGSCCRDNEDDALLGSRALEDDDGEHDFNQLPNRPYEKVYKQILFNEGQTISEEVITYPPPSFVLFHVWLGYILLAFWTWITFQYDFNINYFVFPTYILLGCAVVGILKRGLWFGMLSILFILSAIFLHLTLIPGHKDFTVLEITAPLFFIPLMLIIGSLFVFVFTNSRVLGIISLSLTALFIVWFLGVIGFIYNFLHPETPFKLLKFPCSLTIIPAALLLAVSFLSSFLRLVK